MVCLGFVFVSKYPWARYWTLNCSQCCTIGVWTHRPMVIWMHRHTTRRLIVVPFICLMLQHDIAQHRVTRICTQILEADNILAWAATRHITHSACLGFSGSTCTRVSANIQQLCTAIEKKNRVVQHAAGHNYRTDHLCEGDMSHYMGQTVDIWSFLSLLKTKWLSVALM